MPSICRLFLPALLCSLASAADVTIDLPGSTANWDPALYGAMFDAPSDQQAQAEDIEIVGNSVHPTMYLRYDDQGTIATDSDDEVGFRVRVAGSGATGALAFNSGYILIAVESTGDSAIDFFIGFAGKGNDAAQGIDVYDAGTDTNTSPSTTSIAAPVRLTGFTASNFTMVQVSSTNDPIAGLDTDLNNAPNLTTFKGVDCFLSFKIGFGALESALSAKGVAITSTSQRSSRYSPLGRP